jgi:hypothetical protein
MKPCSILLYNKIWSMSDDLSKIPVKDGFILTDDRGQMDEADVVVFHMPTITKEEFATIKNRAGQLWVFWTMECDAHYQWQYTPEIQALFDITISYNMDADVPLPYIHSSYNEMMRRAPVDKSQLINAFISSDFDLSNRVRCLKELATYIDVHSYGKVMNNREIPKDDGIMTKAGIISGYKFSVAFENAVAKDYVTEKFYHPLIVGSVPVYLGAPNIKDFAPGEHCFINVNDFASVKDLADYLVELDNDPVKYAAYHNWKNEPFRKDFVQKLNVVSKHTFLRLCDIIEKKIV